MKKLRGICLITVLLVASLGFAGVVLDPNKYLDQVDAFVGKQSFESTLKCESRARFFSPVRRAEFFCAADKLVTTEGQVGAEGDSWVADCSEDAVTIYADNGLIWNITKTEFLNAQGNLARLFLPQVSNVFAQEGDITITGVGPAGYTMPSGEKLNAMNITADFRMIGTACSFPILITVVNKAPGVAQVARLRLENITWLRLKEF